MTGRTKKYPQSSAPFVENGVKIPYFLPLDFYDIIGVKWPVYYMRRPFRRRAWKPILFHLPWEAAHGGDIVPILLTKRWGEPHMRIREETR